MSSDPVANFLSRWSRASAAERANYAMFLSELCDALGVPRPDPATADTAHNAYVFERAVTFHHRGSAKTSTGRIDLYRRGCFVLEAKQYAAAQTESATLALELGDPDAPAKSPKIARGTAAWDRAMLEALGQAENYARALPADEDPPPFLLVVDVGHVIELYADFTQKGKNYLPFPDARAHRIRLADLAKPEVRDTLRAVWTAPLSLDPSKRAAAVTREVAGYLAELAKSFEKHHDPKLVAEFLSRCLFCMFAEDVGLLPKESFHQLLESVKGDPGSFVPMLELLFEDMNHGRFSGLLKKKLPYFNGGLFASARALPVNGTQLGLLRRAAALEWRHVEPAIFGTLLERALHPDERHKLGAHYTPRAYVERLVLPTVIEPLREEWSAVRVAAVTLAQRDTAADLRAARATVRQFHERLCAVRVLDPACGSGNFLYVALEQMKRLEGEVVALLHDLGDTGTLNLQGATVDPHQFLGLEINPRAAAIAELVLWIGYLQWHFRVHGDAMPAEPVLKKFNNIECRDAVLAYDKHAFAKDPATGKTRFVWDRKSYKTDPVTGREVPDESRVRPLDTYENPRPATWPRADFIVGNPPFLGTKRMRDDLGDGYVETLRKTYSSQVEDNADFVMYWWHKAAEETLSGRCRRFGLITTNSIRQAFNRRVVHEALEAGLSLRFAIPDHPWVDTADGAAVRIAMTVGARTYALPEKGVVEEPPPDPSELPGDLYLVQSETSVEDGSAEITLAHLRGRIGSGLSIGAELEGMNALRAGEGVCGLGVALHGSGFLLEPDDAREMRKHGASVIKPYLGGGDLLRPKRERYIIDFSFLTEEQARKANPNAFERVVTHVRPERIVNRRETIKRLWWRFGWERPEIRKAMVGLNRFVATTETAKHRVFQFLDGSILPDHMVIIIASDDAFLLGVLSSRIHVVYALAAGGTLEDRPRYNKTRCFDPFPFPDCTEKQKEKIRAFAEELDAHRKRAQATHQLGLTDIYNVLEKLRAVSTAPGDATPPSRSSRGEGAPAPVLTPKERAIHDAALVSTLKQLHDELDAAVADAYGWPWPLTDAEILERVVALNAARAAEEAQGLVRWLRPDYQKPLLAPAAQATLAIDGDGRKPKPAKAGTKPIASRPSPLARRKAPWPKTLAERAKAVESALAAAETPQTAAQLAKRFTRAKPGDVEEILQTLVALSRAHPGDAPATYVR
jgi:type II restriction/modification system DNA methylase subunit YeeA